MSSKTFQPVAQHFYPIKITTTWNALPNEVVNSRTVNSFKNRLDKQWAENPPARCPSKLVAIIDALHNSGMHAQTVVGQRFAGNGPNGLYYCYY